MDRSQPAMGPPPQADAHALELGDTSAVGEAKRHAAALMRLAGGDERAAGEAAIVAAELASNTVRHGGGGLLLLRRLEPPDVPGLELLALDSGPGMANLGESLRDGHSSTGTPGTGLGAVRRLSSVFDIHAPPGRGTAVLSRLGAAARPEPAPPAPFTVGAASLPRRGETVCGDAWAAHQAAGRAVFLVADGLGHGVQAHTAAVLAVQVFTTRAAGPPDELVAALDAALRATRGAAVGVVEVAPARGLVRSAGLGNIAARILEGGGSSSLVFTEGTAGAGGRRARAFERAWPAGGILVMHSDGVARHWDLDDQPGLRSRHPSLIAGVILRDARRERDDATVLVAAHPGDAR